MRYEQSSNLDHKMKSSITLIILITGGLLTGRELIGNPQSGTEDRCLPVLQMPRICKWSKVKGQR